VIAYVDARGATHVEDLNTRGFVAPRRPARDAQQDWAVAAPGTEAAGRTVVHLERRVQTCDPADDDVPRGVTRVLWAMGAADPGAVGRAAAAGSIDHPGGAGSALEPSRAAAGSSSSSPSAAPYEPHFLFGSVSLDLWARVPRAAVSVQAYAAAETEALGGEVTSDVVRLAFGDARIELPAQETTYVCI
jgi:hypothetical protein